MLTTILLDRKGSRFASANGKHKTYRYYSCLRKSWKWRPNRPSPRNFAGAWASVPGVDPSREVRLAVVAVGAVSVDRPADNTL